MIKVYEYEDKIIPSKEYVDALIKDINDKLVNHENSSTAHDDILTKSLYNTEPNVPFEYNELNIKSQKEENINPEYISTDSNNRFVSEQEMMSLKNRPTSFEVEKRIDNLRTELLDALNDKFNTLLNTTNALEKLKTIISIVSEESDVNNLIDTIINTNTDNLIKHENNNLHLTNNDRKALNILIDLCKDGFADWDAKDGDFNAINNKPNLDKVFEYIDEASKYNMKDLVNKQSYDLIIGTDFVGDEIYSANTCDLFLNTDESYKVFNDLTNNHSLYFKNGRYIFEDEINFKDSKIDGYAAIIEGEFVLDNTTIRDIEFYDSIVVIKNNVHIENCTFSRCEVIFNNTTYSVINFCKFFNSTSYNSGALSYNFLTNNTYNLSQIKLIGLNNIVKDNITY